MKKRNFLLIIFVFMAILITGCGKKGYEEISYTKLKEKVDNKETFALFIGRASCSSCDTFKGVLNDLYVKEYAKEATIYYIDTDKLSDDEYKEFHSKYYYEGTPTVTIIIEGKFSSINSVTGSNSYNDMIELMKRKGLLKSDNEEITQQDENGKNEENKVKSDSPYVEITYSDLNKKVNNKETFALFIGRETCSACSTFKSILTNHYTKDYSDQALIYYIDTDKLTDSEYSTFNSTYYYEGTPTITIIEKGVFYRENSVSGTGSFSDMISLMKKKGLLG